MFGISLCENFVHLVERTEIDILKKHVERLESVVESKSMKYEQLEQRMNTMERRQRELNLRLVGVRENRDERCADFVKDVINNDLQLQVNITKAHRTGRLQPNKPRHIIFTVPTIDNNFAILKRQYTALREKAYHITEDLTKYDYLTKRSFGPQIGKAIQESKKWRFRNGRLYVDGQLVQQTNQDHVQIPVQSEIQCDDGDGTRGEVNDPNPHAENSTIQESTPVNEAHPSATSDAAKPMETGEAVHCLESATQDNSIEQSLQVPMNQTYTSEEDYVLSTMSQKECDDTQTIDTTAQACSICQESEQMNQTYMNEQINTCQVYQQQYQSQMQTPSQVYYTPQVIQSTEQATQNAQMQLNDNVNPHIKNQPTQQHYDTPQCSDDVYLTQTVQYGHAYPPTYAADSSQASMQYQYSSPYPSQITHPYLHIHHCSNSSTALQALLLPHIQCTLKQLTIHTTTSTYTRTATHNGLLPTRNLPYLIN